MTKRKQIREKGKIKLSDYFRKINSGEQVAISIDKAINFPFQKRLQGKNGIVVGSRGNFKIIKIKDGEKEKTFLVHPAHLKKIQ